MFFEALSTLIVLYLGHRLWKTVMMRWKYDLHKIPSPPGNLFFGHALDFIEGEEASRIFGRYFRSMGHPKIMRVHATKRTMVIVRDIDCVRSIVLSKTAPFPKDKFVRGGLIRMVGNDTSVKGLLGQQHINPYVKSVRRIYATAFSSTALKQHFPKVQTVLKDMFQIIDNQRHSGPIDIQKLCVKLTLDAIGVVAFEKKLGGLDNSRDLYDALIEVGHYGRQIFFNIRNRLTVKFFPKGTMAKRMKENIDRLTQQWDALTKEIIDRSDPEGDGEVPLWYAVKSMIDPETQRPLRYIDLRTELATIVVAGMDTTGHQLAWLLALLASYPQVAEKILEELTQHGLVGEDAREVQYEDLGELTYLMAVVKEGMRVASITAGLMNRVLPEDMTLMGYRLPKGTVVWIPSNRSMDREEDWSNPNVFRPERWLEDTDMSKKYYLGFSYGPRDCAGQKLAMMELRLGVIEAVKRYEMRMDDHVDDLMRDAQNGIAVEARNGMWMEFIPRKIPGDA